MEVDCPCTSTQRCHRQHPICESCGYPKNAISVHSRYKWRYECPGITSPIYGFLCYKKMVDMIMSLEKRVIELESSK